MNHERVNMFTERLDNFTISDYHGLNSPGLTCYLNSVVQVLFMTEDFRGSIKSVLNSPLCCSEGSTTIDALLGKLFDDLERGLAETHSFVKNLGIRDAYEQCDAAEYLERILCLTSPEASKTFRGELNHKTTCGKCKKRIDSRSYFWILPLTMENSCSQTYSVEGGLKAFFKKEQVYGENKMYCARCNKKQDAEIDCEMTQTPVILTLLLKRFTFDYNWKSYVKLHCKAEVPQTLHMENCKYDLYALVNHFGNLTGGHYTAEIKSFETGEWYCFNDAIVEKVGQPLFGSGNSSLRSHTAYLLMYRKESTHSDQSHEVDQEAQCARLDVEAEGRRDEAERGEALAPPHQLKDESCSEDGNLKHLNGDALKKSYDDAVWKKRTDSSGEVEKRPKRAACVRPRGDKDGGHHEPNKQHLNTNSEHIAAHCDLRIQQKHNSLKKKLKPNDLAWDRTGQNSIATKTDSSPRKIRVKPAETKGVRGGREVVAEVSIEGKSIKQRAKADVSENVGDSVVKSFHVSSNSCSLTKHPHSNCRMNDPSLCSSERNQHVVTSGEGCTREATTTVRKGKKPVSLRTTKNTKKREETVKQQPWR
ncbi:ubiquitin carboxyl-terminal hydrolase 47-like [Seriola dumerili]|uniref:ubiquitin carboxyl-terminal hydrolase 47-like n=1 Tax=Seriola dumerili TaxID=41447 RepID=UPI000BBF2DBD|nr:ubiquitin carboxyl-terminal hydrolase 47-like [Seriola dumerili]